MAIEKGSIKRGLGQEKNVLKEWFTLALTDIKNGKVLQMLIQTVVNLVLARFTGLFLLGDIYQELTPLAFILSLVSQKPLLNN